MSLDVILSRSLVARRKSSNLPAAITLQIAKPFHDVDSDTCKVTLSVEGVDSRFIGVRPVYGIDEFDAVLNAFRLGRQLLMYLQEDFELQWTNGEPFSPLDF